MFQVLNDQVFDGGSRFVRGSRTRIFGAVVLAGVLGFVGSNSPAAAAEDLNILIDRVERLERDIQGISRSVYRDRKAPVVSIDSASGAVVGGTGSQQGNAYTARLSVRINELDEQFRALTGAMESVSHRIDSVTERLNKLVSDIDFRLSNIEHASRPDTGQPSVSAAPTATSVQRDGVPRSATPGVLGTVTQKDLAGSTISPAPIAPRPVQTAPQATSQVTALPQPSDPAPVGVLPAGTPKEKYQFATRKLFKGDYDGAEAAFTEFLSFHDDDPLAGNARYWLGETYYVRKNYTVAAQIFLDGYQRDPKGAKAADSLLKLGMSLGGLNKNREACASFKKLLAEYPNAATPIKKVAARESGKLGCK